MENIVSLLPAIIAIVLALITKETYFSLIIGIIIGGLLFASGDILLAGKTILFNESNGLIANLTNESHICILLFVVMLGIMVMLIRKSGAATAFARFTSKYIKSAAGAKLAAFLMGVLIFIDDGFNCLSVGTALSPVTDKYKISRSKLAYIIDSTAAPICIIAPISSWAAAVSYSLPSDYNVNGFTLFLHTIPYNLYAFGTLFLLIIVIVSNRDFGPMRALEEKALEGELGNETADKLSEDSEDKKGKAMDLIIPMLFLIVACITMMFAFGGGFSGASIKDAFANTNAAMALVSGSIITIIFMFAFYLIRGVMSLHEFMECIPAGWSAFVAPMIILVLAWTLSGMTSLLGAGQFIGNIMSMSAVCPFTANVF